jgi:hypothetical protein
MARQRRRCIAGVALALATALIVGGVLWWFCLPTEFITSDARLSYETGGPPGAVSFVVRDTGGRPVRGVAVASQSHSGWTPDSSTDASGRAIITPGESEVLAVRVGHREVRFRCGRFEEFFSPDCAHGLTVNVVLNGQ